MPTIPTKVSDLQNDSGYITGITSSDVTTALGYTPYSDANPSGYITSSAISDMATQTWVGNQGYLTSVSWSDVSNKPTFSTVATTGDYDDLLDKPTIPTKTSDLNNDSGFITGITSSDVTTALGYTPYDASNPSGYTSNVGTVTSVNNVSPVNGNVTITIPDVSNMVTTDTNQTIGGDKTFSNVVTAYGGYKALSSTQSGYTDYRRGAINNNSSYLTLPTSTGTLALTSDIPTIDQTYSASSTNAQSGVAVASGISSAISGQSHEVWTFTLADGTTTTRDVVLH